MRPRSRLKKELTLFGWLDRLATDQPVLLSFLVFAVAAMIVVPVSVPFFVTDTEGLVGNIVAEGYGMLFDLLIIGWFITWMNRRAERRMMIRGYQEEIENMLRWESPEAMHRIASNIRRLNQEGITEIDLQHAWLQGGYLVEANLAGATARDATFSGAKLERANLEQAELQRAQFELASLVGVRLCGADLSEANLMGAYALRADMEGARLHAANLQGAFLVEADLRNADLTRANFRGALLERTDLRGAALDGSYLDLAKSLFDARLDPEIEAEMREVAPHLFERSRMPAALYQDPKSALPGGDGASAQSRVTGKAVGESRRG